MRMGATLPNKLAWMLWRPLFYSHVLFAGHVSGQVEYGALFFSDVSDALPAKVFYLSMAYTGQKSYACS